MKFLAYGDDPNSNENSIATYLDFSTIHPNVCEPNDYE